MSRFARRVDDSHRTVVRALEAFGCDVEPVQSAKAGRPDIVIGIYGKTHWAEIKPDTKLKKHQPSDAQAQFIRLWRGSPIHVLRSARDVARLMEVLRNARDVEHRAAAALAAQNRGAA